MFAPRKPETAAQPTTSLATTSLADTISIPSNASAAAVAGKTRSGNHSIVDENLTMKGDLESEGDILVKGKVIGNINCKLLIIDNDALVEGGIHAEEVVVRGRAKGTMNAERVRLERSADVDCEIAQKHFSAEEGARIKGSLRFLDDSKASAAGSEKKTKLPAETAA